MLNQKLDAPRLDLSNTQEMTENIQRLHKNFSTQNVMRLSVPEPAVKWWLALPSVKNQRRITE